MSDYIHTPSFDRWNPVLLAEVIRLRAPYPTAYDNAWRKERVIRYAYWLRFRKHPSLNLIGSWEEKDLVREIDSWTSIRTQNMDEDQAEQALSAMLENTYKIDYYKCLAIVTNHRLAKNHMPVWDMQSGSLLPEELGNCILYDVVNDEERPGLGTTYCYGYQPTNERLSVIIYNRGFESIRSGLDDPRCFQEFEESLQVAKSASESRGEIFVPVAEPVIESLRSLREQEVKFWTSAFVMVNPSNNLRHWSVLSLTCFRGHFLKLRYSLPMAGKDDETSEAATRKLNTDIADYVTHFMQ